MNAAISPPIGRSGTLRFSFLIFVFAVLSLAACASQGRQKELDTTLRQYESMVRFSEWDGAIQFLAVESLEEHPVTPLDVERLRQFRVSNYTVRSSLPYDEGNGLRQTVEIRLFNKNRVTERSILDNQDWRYDESVKGWRLYSGLPDVTQGR